MALEFNADKEILKSNSLKIKNNTSLNLRLGGGADEKSALFSQLSDDVDKLVRVGINTLSPQYELDVEGQIRTTTSIISDTARINNLDIDTIVNPQLNLKAPNLQSFVDPETGTTFFPTAETPAFDDDTNKVATTNFVYNIATNDVGGRIYVSEQIGNDDFDGRSATKPVRSIKKAAQIAGTTPDKETLIVAGGDYLEDNPISIPDKCSVVGDNIRLCIIRPRNPNKHMFKNQNENYMIGVTFRDKIQTNSEGFEEAVATWDYAYVFDDKQRMYYDKTLGGQYGRDFPIGYQIFGEGIFRIQFNRANVNDPEFEVGDEIVGVATGSRAIITEKSFGLPESDTVSERTSQDLGFLTVNNVRGALEQGDTFKYTPVPVVGAVRWETETEYTLGQVVFTDTVQYEVTTAGTSGTVTPSHTSGAATNGTVEFTFTNSIPQYEFVGTKIFSLRAEGEVTQHVTSHTSFLLEQCYFDDAYPDGMVFETNNYHDFEVGQWVDFAELPATGAGADLNRFNGRQYVTHRIEQTDGFSKKFVVFKDTPAAVGTPANPFTLTTFAASATSSDNYVKFSLLNSPFKFEESEKQGHRYLDGADLIRRNREFIADEALIRTKAKYPALIIPNEDQCKTDIKHIVNAVQYDLAHGGNAASLEAANNYIVGGALTHISSQLTETRYAFEQARELAVLAIRNRIQYLDGLSITANANAVGTVNSVKWVNTQFIAVGDSGVLLTSPDGETWTSQTNPIAGADYKDIVWNGTTTVVVGGNGGNGVVITSNNGVNWAIAENSLGSAVIETIAWDDDAQWVGFGGTQWFSSDDGQDWTARGSFVPINGSGTHSVVDVIWDYKNSQFVSVSSGGSAYTSPDGVTWTERTTTASSFSAITANEDVLIAAAGDVIYKSTDGITWELGIANSLVADRYADAADLILANKVMIAEIAVNKMLANNPGFNIPTGNQACKDDVIDFLEAMVIDLQYGGNDQTYDAANLYVTGAHVSGEEDESAEVFGYAETLAIAAMRNEAFNTTDVQNYASGLLQSFDNSITVDTSSPYCANVESAIQTLFGILDQAIGTTASPGNLTGITRTPSGKNNNKLYHDGYQFWCTTDDGLVRSYDGRAWTVIANTAGINFTAIATSYNELVSFATAVSKFYMSDNLVAAGTSTETTFRDTTISNTYEANRDYVCANVTSAIYTYFEIIDTVISGGTAPDRTLPEKSFVDNGSKFVTFARNFLDLPIVEVSPYIFNSSVISFLGGSGCEIDGAKVATPNIIRPGLPEQGKSMVAAAFTIISFGGTGYRVVNDGYTQLVSVFCIFTRDGALVESGGYASLTNSASNFGLFALRATGFREDPYTFDVGKVDNITFDLIGTPSFEITNINQEPREHYIIKIDGIKSVLRTGNNNPEYFIDSVLQVGQTTATVQADANMFLIGNENRYTDAAVLIERNKKYIAEEAFYTELYSNVHSFQPNYDKCIRDTELIVQAIADDIRDDGNAFTWDAGKLYIESNAIAHITGYTAGTKAVFDEAVILCKKAINNQLKKIGTTLTSAETTAGYYVAQYTNVVPYVDTTVIHDVSSPAGEVGTSSDLYSNSDCANVQSAIDTLNTLIDEILDNPTVASPLPSGAVRDNGQFLLDNSTRYKLLNHTINLHRPSICNSSSHTWEFSGSGINYNALPQNGGKRGSEDTADFEQVSQQNGRVYASGTDELGNFKVGYFANIENRTGNITFGGTVEIEEVAFLKIKGGDIEIVGFSGDEKLGDITLGSTELNSDRILATQASIREYITNNYGNYKNQPYGTTPSPGNLVQLDSTGRINIDQIPALRPFNVFTVPDLAGRLGLEGPLAGDIVIQLAPNNISYILNNDAYSQIIEFAPDPTYTFNVSDVVNGSPSTAQGTVTSYIHGEVSPVVSIISGGSGYTSAPAVIIGIQYANSTGYGAGAQVAANGNLYNVTVSGTTASGGSGPNHTSGDATDGTVTFTYVGVAATGTATIDNNRVSGITITNRGSGYESVPSISFDNTGTNGSSANASANIRSRLAVTLIGNIKFATADTIDDFTTPTAQTINITNVVNTSGQLEANWVQLTSTNIDAGSITTGVINPTRLANVSADYPANSNTYLRGDSRFVPVVSSLRKNAAETPIVISSSNQRLSYIDSVEITDGGSGYTTGNFQSQTVTGGQGNGFLADFLVSDGAVRSISVTNGGTGYRLVVDENVTPVVFAEEPPEVIFKDSNGLVLTNVQGKAITTNGVVTEVRILDGGSGFSAAPLLEFRGVGNSAAATATIADGVISRVSVVEGGIGYNADFDIVTLPSSVTGGSGHDIEAKQAEVAKVFNDITIDIRRGDNLTIAGDDFSNLGVWRFYKSQWDFGVDGALTLRTGGGSELDADKLDGEEGSFYRDADNINTGTLNPDRLSGNYTIDVTGTATQSLNLNLSDLRQSTQAPSNAPLGTRGQWKKNADNSLFDGGSDHTVYGSRRGTADGTTFDGYAVTEFAFTDNNNQWIRGHGGNFVGSIAITKAGNGYTPGVYKAVALGGGEGYGLKADITVNTSGQISNVTIVDTGYGYNETGNAPSIFTAVLPENVFGLKNGRQYDSGYVRWASGQTYNINTQVYVPETIGFGRLYTVTQTGTSGTTEPTHTSGNAQAVNGTAVFDFAGSLGAELTANLAEINDNLWSSWYKVWTSGNDGVGSGMDSEFLTGKSGLFYRSATNINEGYLSNRRLPSNFGPKGIVDSLNITRFDPQVQINNGSVYEFILDDILLTNDDLQVLDTGGSSANLNGDTFYTLNLYTDNNVNQGTINVLSVTPNYEADNVWEIGYSNVTAVDFDPETAYTLGQLVYVIIAGTLGETVYLYEVTSAGESGTTSLNHTSGTVTNGTVDFRFVSEGIPPNREVQYNNNIYITEDFIRTPKNYTNNLVLGVGTLVIANQNLYTVTTAGTTSASGNGPTHTAGAATDGSVGFTYVSARPNIIPIHGPDDGTVNGVRWDRISQLSHTKVEAELISGVLNETVVKFGTAVNPATYYNISDFGLTSSSTYSINKHRLFADGTGNPVISLGNEGESTSGQIRFFTSGNAFTLPNGDPNLDGYDVRILASGGTSTVGTGTINFQANAAQVNGNNIWHAGNITFQNGIDSVNAAYDTGANSTGVIRDSNGDIGFRNAYGDLIGIASENLPLSGGTLTGQLKQQITDTTTWSSSITGQYSYEPYPHELAVLNSEAGNSSTFASLYLQAGRNADGARYSSARVTAIKAGDYQTDLAFGVRDSTFYERVRIRYNGNVGIGVTAANIGSKLTVNATGGGGYATAAADAGILFKNFDVDGGYPSFFTLDNAFNRDIGIGLAREGTVRWNIWNDANITPNDILRITNSNGDHLFSMYQRSDAADVTTSRVGMFTGLNVPTHTLTVNGTFSAKSKSFLIDHPTKENYKLQHGSLEGPEHGVYVRGRVTDGVITLPDYWLQLVDEDTITVQLTAIGDSGNRWVIDVADNKVTTGGGAAFYFVQAERKDVPKMEVEMEIKEVQE